LDSQEITLAGLLFRYAMEEHRQSVEGVMANKDWFISFLTNNSGLTLRKQESLGYGHLTRFNRDIVFSFFFSHLGVKQWTL
jgi:hypothetical protein